jgi:hypothetical protein
VHVSSQNGRAGYLGLAAELQGEHLGLTKLKLEAYRDVRKLAEIRLPSPADQMVQIISADTIAGSRAVPGNCVSTIIEHRDLDGIFLSQSE